MFVARGKSDNAAIYGRYLLEVHAGPTASMPAPIEASALPARARPERRPSRLPGSARAAQTQEAGQINWAERQQARHDTTRRQATRRQLERFRRRRHVASCTGPVSEEFGEKVSPFSASAAMRIAARLSEAEARAERRGIGRVTDDHRNANPGYGHARSLRRPGTSMVFVGVPRTLEAGLCRWARVMAVLCS
jgi:hypothetical protein